MVELEAEVCACTMGTGHSSSGKPGSLGRQGWGRRVSESHGGGGGQAVQVEVQYQHLPLKQAYGSYAMDVEKRVV